MSLPVRQKAATKLEPWTPVSAWRPPKLPCYNPCQRKFQESGHDERERQHYLISVSSLNIGMYIAITIVPTIAPTAIIMIGSMMDVSAWMLESTSSS